MSNNRILYVQFANPAAYPPLQHSSRILADEGNKVFFLGTKGQSTNQLEFPKHENIKVRKIGSRSPGLLQKLNYLCFILSVYVMALLWRPKWIYFSDPLSTPAGMLLVFLPRTYLLYHEHDSPSAKEIRESNFFMRFVFNSRGYIARKAEVCILPCEDRVKEFRKQTGRCEKIHIVWNVPSKKEVGKSLKSGKNEYIRLVYQGSLNDLRLPYSILEALKVLPEHIKLRVIGYETSGHLGYKKDFLRKAEREGVQNRVEMLSAVPRHRLLKLTRECNIGLALMPMKTQNLNLKYMAGASNKPFEYLSQGLPVLVSELPTWEKMFVEPGYGLACDPHNASSIIRALKKLIENRKSLLEMGKKGRQKIKTGWNYEKQFQPVMERINSV